MQFGYLYDSAVNYASTFDLNNGGLGFSKTYNVATPSDVVGGSIRDRGLNLLTDRIAVNDSDALVLANVNGTTDRFFSGAVIKVNNEDNDDGISLATLAQSSASYANTYQDAAPISGNKQYLQADLERYLRSAFTRTEVDNFVFVAFAAEPGPVANQVLRVNNMIDSVESAYADAGFTTPEFILISTWRNVDNDATRAQAEVFDTVANSRSNVAMISMYGLTEGMFLDGTTDDQIDWSTDNSYDSISLNNGSLDVTNLRLIDTEQALHQDSEEAAFFFAYLLNKEIRAEGTVNPIVTSSGGGVILKPYSGTSNRLKDSDNKEVKQDSPTTVSNPIINLFIKIFRSNLPLAVKGSMLRLLSLF